MKPTKWANARRTQVPLSLILFDIDFFKQYNDRYGHIAGDDRLRRVGQTLPQPPALLKTHGPYWLHNAFHTKIRPPAGTSR